MRFGGILSGVKVRNKIFFLTIAGIFVFILFSLGGLIVGKSEIRALERMYANDVVPLENLRKIQLAFREIESGMGRAMAGTIKGTEEVKHLKASAKEIDTLWGQTSPRLLAETLSDEKEKFTKGYKGFNGMVNAIESAYLKLSRDNDIEPIKNAYNEWLKFKPIAIQSTDRMAVAQGDVLRHCFTKRIKLINKIRIAAVSGAVIMTVWFIVFTLLIVRSINKPIETIVQAAREVGSGDLTCTINLDRSDEMGVMASELNAMIIKLNKTFRIIADEAENLFQHAEGLSGVSDLLVSGAEDERMQVNTVSVSAEQMSSAITDVGKTTSEAEKMTEASYDAARDGSDIVEETKSSIAELSDSVAGASEAIGNLGDSSNRVGEIVSVIKGIADQTNLLALNAAIESARAGEQGRGFAVVADEVRKLAERTTEATGEVTDIIQTIQAETKSVISRLEKGKLITESAISKAEQAGESHNSIVNSCGNVLGMVQTIASATEEQSVASRQVSDSMGNIAGVINQTVMLSENIRSVASELTSVASQMRNQIESFKTQPEETEMAESVRLDVPGVNETTVS
jgi:methyl-accepting chemotaxis protein